MYTLFYSPGSASLVVHQTLLEIGAPYTLRRVDFAAREQKDPDYLALNPQGVVPTLVVDGQAYGESAALLQLLTERHPASGLAPAPGSPQRAQWLYWTTWLSTTLGACYRAHFYPADLGLAEWPPAQREALQQRFAGFWTQLEQQLQQHGPWLLGEQMSTADLQLMMYLRWSRNMQRPATQWPGLAAFAARMAARPSWQQAHQLEGLPLWP